ncbi:MAG: hypothetical protein ACRD8O_15440 [Bryobacteraceae bacterium]
MHALFAALWLLAAPFWETRPPSEWTQEQLEQMMRDSPWARTALAPSILRAGAVQTFLATARPIQLAEEELARRSKRPPREDPDPDDFREFLRQKGAEVIVLSIAYANPGALSDAAESRRMQEDCVMRVDRKTYRITGHFPPTPGDPYLRLVFPRAVKQTDKRIIFQLYLPGVTNPFRDTEYDVKELVYRGKLEM